MAKIKRIFSIILIVVLFSYYLSACKGKDEIEDKFDSVYEIHCTSESKFESVGTAFKIHDKIVSCAHVISYTEYGEKINYDNIYLIPYNNKEKIAVGVEFVDYALDFAVLKLINEDYCENWGKNLSVGKSSNVKIGDKLYTIGNLNNYGLAYSEGCLSAKEKKVSYNDEEQFFFQSDIEISKGSSGGPVFDSKGNVVGMMVFKVRDSNMQYVDGVSFFMPIERVCIDY